MQKSNATKVTKLSREVFLNYRENNAIAMILAFSQSCLICTGKSHRDNELAQLASRESGKSYNRSEKVRAKIEISVDEI